MVVQSILTRVCQCKTMFNFDSSTLGILGSYSQIVWLAVHHKK